MSEQYIGQIIPFGGNFAIRSYAQCDGQLLSIAQNSALFSILGTTYGGDGRTTFGLPELRGRVAMHYGSGPGLPPVTLGQKAGSRSVTLTSANMPTLNGSTSIPSANSAATTADPNGNVPAQGLDPNAGTPVPTYAAASAANGNLATGTVTFNGGSQPFSIEQPYQAINWQIVLQGLFPPRN